MLLQQLVYFVEVAEQGSINKAAEKLLLTQPNLSKAIMNLEAELGIQIFHRNNKGVILTDDGKKLYQYSRTILNQMNLITNISAKDASRVLSISSYPIITMSKLLSNFYMKYKEADIIFNLTEGRLQEVIEQVESGESEVGFIMSNHAQSRELKHMLNYKNLELNMIGKDTWYLNVGPYSPFYHRKEVAMEELKAYPCVRLPDDYFSHLTFYLEIDGIKLTELKRVVYVNNGASIINLLQNTDVYRFGPLLSAPDYKRYGIHTIPIKNCNLQINVGWIRRKKEILSKEAEAFVTMLQTLYPISHEY